jgi:hypothetical protein
MPGKQYMVQSISVATLINRPDFLKSKLQKFTVLAIKRVPKLTNYPIPDLRQSIQKHHFNPIEAYGCHKC